MEDEIVRITRMPADRGMESIETELKDGTVKVLDSWYGDERSTWVKADEMESWIGRSYQECADLVGDRDVAWIRSWV
jgi:hypothetical protein